MVNDFYKLIQEPKDNLDLMTGQSPAIRNQEPQVVNQIQQTPVAPVLDKELQGRVQATQGTLNANQNFVNAAVKAYTGQDATQEQLDKFTGKSVDIVRSAFAPTPTPTTTIDLTENKPDMVQVGDSTGVSLTGVDAYVSKVDNVLKQLQQPTAELTGLEKTQEGLEDRYVDLLTKQATLGERTLSLEEKFAINEKAEKLKTVDAEIMGKIAEYNRVNEQIASSPITAGSIRNEQNHIKRLAAADISVLEAQRAVYQGQYDVATDAVNRAIDLEFGDIEQNIQNTLDFMTINENKMTAEEKKQSERTAVVLDAMQEVLSEQKADKTANYNLMMEVLKAGGNASSVDMSLTPEQNVKNVGSILAPVISGVNTSIETINGVKYVINSDTKDIIRRLDEGIEPTVDFKTIDEATTRISEIDQLINHSGLNSAVGPTFLTRGNKLNWWDKLTGNTQEFIGGVQQIISQDTLDTLVNLKKEGGTLGALSDQERIMLQNAATKIGAWAITDKNGNVVGYNISEKAFKKELERIKELSNKAIKEAGGETYLKFESEIENILKDFPNATNEEIMEIIGETSDFNNVGGDTNQASNIQIGAGVAKRTNNPGNLVFVGQQGATKDTQSRFAKFNTPQEGFNALMGDIEAKKDPQGRLNSNSTLAEMISVYAPPSENATNQYIQQIAKELRVSPNTKIGQIPTYELAKAIAKKESSTIIT